ncbi:hypothetical protein [Sphingorhabdus sp.]|uniref:hypothetical protein n=1 Tax=Sphingorhabdus sp. TaxID=1902408 RepID=UPI00333EED9D
MPRYNAANLAALDPDYRKANNIGTGGTNSKSRYAYGKQNNILIASGGELMASGLCLRLLPMYEESNGEDRQFANFREGRDNVAYGDWQRLVTCAHWVGNPGICFIVHDGNPDVNMYESPLHVLRKVAYDNSKDNPHPTLGRLFSELLSKEFVRNSHIGSLKKPEKTLLVSASVVFVDDHGKITLGAFSDDNKRNARIIGLKTSAGEAMLSALKVQDESTGEHLSGDMLSFGTAKLFTILPESFKSGGPNLAATGPEGVAAFQCPKFARGPAASKYVVGYPNSRSDYTHFGILHDTFNEQEISLEPYADRIVAETGSWADYLRLPTYEEQAEMLAPVFPREALDFAWREYPEYMRALPKGTATFSGASVSVEELDETHYQKTVTRQPALAVKPASSRAPASMDPPAPWDPPAAELSAEEEAGVADMFSDAAAIPPPVVAPQAAAPAVRRDSADILAKARARAAGKK